MIDRIGGIQRIGAVRLEPSARSTTRPTQTRTDSVSLSLSPMRTAVARAHSSIDQLQDLSRFVDSASGALDTVHSLLQEGTQRIADGIVSTDDMLTDIDHAARSPRLGGESALAEGVTLRAGSREIDIRPISALDLGAIVETGRSHRLADVRTGGSLDPAGSRSGALRCVAAAMREVADVQSSLQEYRSQVLEPMQRGSLDELASAANSPRLSERGTTEAAAEVRLRMFSGDALSGVQPEHALALLSSRRL